MKTSNLVTYVYTVGIYVYIRGIEEIWKSLCALTFVLQLISILLYYTFAMYNINNNIEIIT